MLLGTRASQEVIVALLGTSQEISWVIGYFSGDSLGRWVLGTSQEQCTLINFLSLGN
jgi:hypothetical protein